MKTKLKKVISTCLAAVMLLSTILGSSISVSAAVDNDGRYVPSDGVETNRYYFLMPDDWFNEYTSDAGIYWWDATDAPDSWEDMHKAQKGDCDNVFYVDCPKDVTVIIWTNMLSDGGEFAKMTVNIPLGNYDPDESPLYPDGLPSFDNMIYVCTNIREVVNELTGLTQMNYEGDWYFYYGDGKYGTTAEPTTPESTSGDFKYTILDDGTAEITGYTGDATEVTIPSELDGKSVTSIGWFAFSDCENLTSVTIPNSVTSIGGLAFWNCESLENVTIPDSVTNIGEDAFSCCRSLSNIYVDSKNSSFTSMDGVLFDKEVKTLICYPAGKNSSSYSIPDSVTSIGYDAFFGSTSLTSITIPDSVTEIGWSAFFRCTSLASITIPDSVTEIGYGAFENTAWYDNQPDGVIYAGKVLYTYKGEMPQNTTITVKDGTKSISGSAFSDCENLTSITIPNTVTSIGEGAFYDCKSLTGVIIPDSVTSIGYYALGYYNDNYNELKIDGFTITSYSGSAAEQYANENGFEFISLGEAPTEPTTNPDEKVFLGDVNGDSKVNIKDATAIQKSAASLVTLTEKQNKAADVNADGKVNVNDATAIQRYVAGIDTGFKIGE